MLKLICGHLLTWVEFIFVADVDRVQRVTRDGES